MNQKFLNDTVYITKFENEQDILPELVNTEYNISKNNLLIKKIELDISQNILNQNLSRLEKLNYQLNNNGKYSKDVVYKKSARFSITEKCNYKCFFCHEEGLEMTKERSDTDYDKAYSMFDKLKIENCQDLTFTGGEPLLRIKKIIDYMKYMMSIEYTPDITIVSNGIAINKQFLDFVKNEWTGKLRFNISMHSLDNEDYGLIVDPSRAKTFAKKLDKVKEKLSLLKDYDVPFKLNFVLLKGYNTDIEKLEKIFDYALSVGATHIKFLELLITENLKRFYNYYFPLEALKRLLEDDLTLIGQDARRHTYQYKNTSLNLELQNCTCASGCNMCLINRDMNFTAETKYFPCFLRPEISFPITNTSMRSVVNKGEKFINKMAKEYKDESPILIKDGVYKKSIKDYFYAIDENDVEDFKSLITKATSARLDRYDERTEYYVEADILSTFANTKKIIKNEHDDQYICIDSTTTLNDDSSIVTEFSSSKKNVNDSNNIENYKYKFDWKFEYFTISNDNLEISIGQELNTKLYFIRANKALGYKKYLKPLSKLPIHSLIFFHR